MNINYQQFKILSRPTVGLIDQDSQDLFNKKLRAEINSGLYYPDTIKLLNKAIKGKFGDLSNYNIFAKILIKAIKNNNKEIVKFLLNQNTDINYLYNGKTPLMIAIVFNNIKMANLLCKYGADVNIDYFGVTAISLAIESGSFDLVNLLIFFGAKINIMSRANKEPMAIRKPLLFLAINKNLLSIIELLIFNGYNTKAIDINGYTCLYSAIISKKWKSVKNLLRINILKNTISPIEENIILVNLSKEDKRILNLFLQKIQDKKPKEAKIVFSQILKKSNEDLAKHLFLEALKTKDKKLIKRMFYSAIKYAKPELFKWFFLQIIEKLENTGLITYLFNKTNQIQKQLLIMPSLIKAIKLQNIELSLFFSTCINYYNLESQINWDLAIFLAIKNNNPKVVNLLLSYTNYSKIFDQLFLFAITKRSKKIIKLFINKKSTSSLKSLILHCAIAQNNEKVVELLLDNNYSASSKACFNTALILATELNLYNIVLLLLRYNAELNTKNISGETALTKAIKLGYNNISQILTDYSGFIADITS